jgi:hypothetical protein
MSIQRFVVISLLCILCFAGCSADVVTSEATRLRQAVESAVERGDMASYQKGMRDLETYMNSLTKEDSEKFAAQWRDPAFGTWVQQMSLEMAHRKREQLLARRQPGTTEPLTDTITHLVTGMLGDRNTNPRVKDVTVDGKSLVVAYRTYSTAEGRTGRLSELSKIGQLLKALAGHAPLRDLESFQIEAYQELGGAGVEELVIRVKLNRKSVGELPRTGLVSERLTALAKERGTLWLHERFRGTR